MSAKLMIYGATGFVGGHIARTAVGSGLPTILAGRDAARLELMAADLGVERRAFGLDVAAEAADGLKGGPPFSTAPDRLNTRRRSWRAPA